MDLEPSSRSERLIAGLRRLAGWPRPSPRDPGPPLELLLGQAAAVLSAPRILLAWEEIDEPWLHLASWADGGPAAGRLERFREPPGEPLVPAELAEASFLSGGPGEAWLASEQGLERFDGAPVAAELARRFSIGRSASWPLRGDVVEGRLWSLDGEAPDRDGLVLGEVVALRLAAELDRFYLIQKVRTAAVTEERIRLACDLHDGMLQSLTGTALQLKAVGRLLEDGSPEAGEQLREVQRLIASDQRDLRFFIEELKPVPRALSGPADLYGHLLDLAARVERLWGLRVELRLDLRREGGEGEVPEAFTRQLYRLLREALFNVARHAGASNAQVEVRRGEEDLSITVTDDGRGFPFRGRYEHDELVRQKLGPVSLKERISSLGGSLAIDSCPGKTRLEVQLPISRGSISGGIR